VELEIREDLAQLVFSRFLYHSLLLMNAYLGEE
jgi:hypothetical protein